MKLVPIIFALILGVVLTLGCVDQQTPGRGNGVTYISFTNGEFYVEYPSDWDVFVEDQSVAGIATKAFIGAEDEKGAGLYIRGHNTQDSSLYDFDEWFDTALEELQSSEESTILDYEKSINEAFIEFTSVKSGDVTVYTKYKFIACIDTVFQCTASVENILRGDYQEIINHIISSFKCES